MYTGANKQERIRKLKLGSTPPVGIRELGNFKSQYHLVLYIIRTRLLRESTRKETFIKTDFRDATELELECEKQGGAGAEEQRCLWRDR